MHAGCGQYDKDVDDKDVECRMHDSAGVAEAYSGSYERGVVAPCSGSIWQLAHPTTRHLRCEAARMVLVWR